MNIKTTNQIVDKSARIIRNEIIVLNDNDKKWIAFDDLIERIETICNHGNKRDMRFRDYLIKSMEDKENGMESSTQTI